MRVISAFHRDAWFFCQYMYIVQCKKISFFNCMCNCVTCVRACARLVKYMQSALIMGYDKRKREGKYNTQGYLISYHKIYYTLLSRNSTG